MTSRQAACLAVLAASGCATSLRAGVFPTVDDGGRFGVLLKLTAGAGALLSRTDHGGVIATASLEGGVIDGTPAGRFDAGVGIDGVYESPRLGFRLGATGSIGLVADPRAQTAGALGGRVALLPVLRFDERHQPPGSNQRVLTWHHLGVEGSAEYLFGVARSGLFSLGLLYEFDRFTPFSAPN